MNKKISPWTFDPSRGAEFQLRVRMTDKDGTVIASGRVIDIVDYRENPSINDDGNRVGSAVVEHDAPFVKPLWYGGGYSCAGPSYFTLPSGHENIWGCGNDFDTDTFRLHPDDLAEIMKKLS